MLNIESIRDIFYSSQQRYLQYYLEKAGLVQESPVLETNAELSNYEQAFTITLQEPNISYTYAFWEALSNFLWEHGYWYQYFEWADQTLQVLKIIGENRMPEARLMSELGYLKLEWGDWQWQGNCFLPPRKYFMRKMINAGLQL